MLPALVADEFLRPELSLCLIWMNQQSLNKQRPGSIWFNAQNAQLPLELLHAKKNNNKKHENMLLMPFHILNFPPQKS